MSDTATVLILEDIRKECDRAESKGFDAAHDDDHVNPCVLPLAAAALALHGEPGVLSSLTDHAPEWVKHACAKWGKRRRLVIAAQFIVAEIRRLDRE